MEHINRLPRYYESALVDLNELEGNISDDQYLEVYGLFQQAFFGDMYTSSRPKMDLWIKRCHHLPIMYYMYIYM